MKPEYPVVTRNTALGILAILFWSTSIAFSRILTEELGTLTSATYMNLASGIIGSLYYIAKPKSLHKLLDSSIYYLTGCGTLFVAYMVCFYMAIGFSSGRQQVLTIGMINYLWPSFTLVFSIPILNKKARKSLLPGIIIATIGVFLAMIQSGPFSLEIFMEDFRLNSIPYILAFMASICWGLYSNLSRRWGGDVNAGAAVPFFLLSTGLILLAVKPFFFDIETTRWTSRVVIQFLYVVLFPGLLSYVFWDAGIRKGDHTLLASLSYFIPLFSTVISSLLLEVFIGLYLWIALLLVITGAIICKVSVHD